MLRCEGLSVDDILVTRMVTICNNVTDPIAGGKNMNLGIESETLEFKKSTGEIRHMKIWVLKMPG